MSSITDLTNVFIDKEIISKVSIFDGFNLACALGKSPLRDFVYRYRKDIEKYDYIQPGDLLISIVSMKISRNSPPFDYHVNWNRVIKRTKKFVYIELIEQERSHLDDALIMTRPVFPIAAASDVSKKHSVKRIPATEMARNGVFVQQSSSAWTSIDTFYQFYAMDENSEALVVSAKNVNFGR